MLTTSQGIVLTTFDQLTYTDIMPYPDEAEGFQVDGPETFTQFHKRMVSFGEVLPADMLLMIVATM